jgi:UDP-N-acetylglucosamine transferase subunit ALG13
MIFVTVGTNEARFDRLLRCVELLHADEIVVQYGCSTFHPRNARCFAFTTFEELVGYMRASAMVITHAGVGSVAVAIAATGRRPVVVPRLHRYGEAIDDHQVALARKLADNGLVTLVEEPEHLGELDIQAAVPTPLPSPTSATLVSDLSDCIHMLLEGRATFSKAGDSATVSGRGVWGA